MTAATAQALPAAVPAMTNEDLGRLIGCTHSMASRIRHGIRLPGDETMLRISEIFGWPTDEQIRAKLEGAERYGELFRQRLVSYQRAKRTAA